MAVRATAVLICTQLGGWERYVLGDAAQVDEDGRRDLVLDVARARYAAVPFQELSEESLASSYELLRHLFPPALDKVDEETHVVTAEEDAWRLRDGFLNLLAERGTPVALSMLARLTATYPDDLRVAAAMLRGRRAIFANAWVPPEPADIADLLADAARRLVRSESELATFLAGMLPSIEHDARAHGELLWDRIPSRLLGRGEEDLWLPKPEAAFAAYLAHELAIRLEGRGLAVNREILVRPTDPYGAGDRTDILVEANVREEPITGLTPGRLTVVIELKGCWNARLLTDMETQLVERYLPEASSSSGLYLVAWFPLDEWAESDYRRQLVARI